MKSSVKITALVLALLFVLSAFCGCTGSPVKPDGKDSDAANDDTTVAETTEAPPVDIEIDGDNAGEYVIIRAEHASEAVKKAAAAFRVSASDTLGNELKIKEDWVQDPSALPEKAKEIVIGKSNRHDSAEIEKELREQDFAIIFKNDRIYIIGGSDDATLEALEYFQKNYLDKDGKKIKVNDRLKDFRYHEYSVKKVEIDGINIRDYTVIIPEKSDLCTLYAAENLSDFFKANAGFSLTVTTDKSAETDYEIIIGDSAREASKVSASCADGQYILYKNDKKVVCLGKDYMVGGGVGALLSRIPVDGKNVDVNITDLPTAAAAETFKFKEAKNAILMIGDGMGFNTVEMSLPKIGSFVADSLPNKGNAYTGSLTTQATPTKPTDSAASGTALATGTKTTNGYVGVDKSNNPLLSIRELADEKGAMTGVISTDLITGATPSAFLAHYNDRNATAQLKQQIDKLVTDRKVDWCSGNIGDNLRSDTAAALGKFSAGGSQFFLMVEEGHIDKRSHSKDATGCINMVKRFNDDIAYAIEFVLCHPDTVLIVTADHETGGITKNADGTFKYTVTTHTTANVPVYAIGTGTEYFNGKTVDNTEIPKFMAKLYGDNSFGQ